MNPVEQTKQKMQVTSEALDLGMIQVFVNTKYPGVVVPKDFLGNPALILNLSRRFKDNVELLDDGIHTKLSFLGMDHIIVLPWPSIWLLKDRNKQGLLFPWDVPEELKKDLPPSIIDQSQGEPGIMPQPPKHELFEMIEGDGETTPPRTGHLRVVH